MLSGELGRKYVLGSGARLRNGCGPNKAIVPSVLTNETPCLADRLSLGTGSFVSLLLSALRDGAFHKWLRAR